MTAIGPFNERSLPGNRKRFAAIVPVASTAYGLWCGMELIQSLVQWEPDVGWCLLLEDSDRPQGIADLALLPSSCRIVSILNPLKEPGAEWTGALSSGILKALSWIQRETPADFVLRIDTDALVIDRFAEKVRACLGHRTEAGVIGAMGGSCNPEGRLRNPPPEARILRACQIWPRASDMVNEPTHSFVTPGGHRLSIEQLAAFDAVRPHVARAVANGYSKYEDCQGGACVIARRMIDRMAESGYFEQFSAWTPFPFPDDQVLAMYAYAVGLRLVDYSQPGEPFGVQYAGLAYEPEELVTRGYSIIHSVKNDPRHDEHTIRDFFRTRSHQARAN